MHGVMNTDNIAVTGACIVSRSSILSASRPDAAFRRTTGLTPSWTSSTRIISATTLTTRVATASCAFPSLSAPTSLTSSLQRNQPTMGVFAVQKLGDALAELIGCEEDIAKAEEGSSRIGYVQADEAWGEGGEATGCMEGWRAKGLEKVEEVKSEFVEVFTAEYTRLMRLVRLSPTLPLVDR